MDYAEIITGTDYEKFIKEVYEQFAKKVGKEIRNIEHNISVTGKSGAKHQIDVHLEMLIEGKWKKIAIECKYYNTSNIAIGKIRDFYGALNDIGDTNGIFCAIGMYQKGAKQFADFYGIELMEVRFPNNLDWEGRVKDIHLTTKLLNLKINAYNPVIDHQWFKANQDSFQHLIVDDQFSLQIEGFNTETFIYDKNGIHLGSSWHLQVKLQKLDHRGENLQHTFTYENGYLDIGNSLFVKLSSIIFSYSHVPETVDELHIKGEELVKTIIKNVQSKSMIFLRNE